MVLAMRCALVTRHDASRWCTWETWRVNGICSGFDSGVWAEFKKNFDSNLSCRWDTLIGKQFVSAISDAFGLVTGKRDFRELVDTYFVITAVYRWFAPDFTSIFNRRILWLYCLVSQINSFSHFGILWIIVSYKHVLIPMWCTGPVLTPWRLFLDMPRSTATT